MSDPASQGTTVFSLLMSAMDIRQHPKEHQKQTVITNVLQLLNWCQNMLKMQAGAV